MRIVAFSDLHNDLAQAERLVELASTVDVVIGAGDFCNAHHGLRETLAVLSVINRPAVLVPGNAETDEELREAAAGWTSAIVLHGDGMEIDGVPFFGIGGGIPVTPFGSWSFDFTEDDAALLLADCPAGGILVSHSPPKGAVDVSSRGKSIGSTAVRETIGRASPKLVVCGHIHACGGQMAQIGSTPVLNAGPAGRILTVE
jgi:Icc-related predicted phosphoesterase